MERAEVRERRRAQRRGAKGEPDLAMRWEALAVLAGAVVGLWCILLDWPDGWARMAALVLPPLALLAAIGLNLRLLLAGLKPSYRPLFWGAMFSSIGLLWSVWADYDFLDGHQWDVVVCVTGVAAIAVPALFRRKESELSKFLAWTWYAAAALACILCYADGAVKQLDVWLDTSKPAVYHPAVLEKRSHYRQRPWNHYYVTVSAWGPNEKPDEIGVSQSFYDRAENGMRLCARVHDGYFKLRYETVDFCG
jgi:hypothetical protein